METISTENLIKNRNTLLMENQFIGFVSDIGNTALQHMGRLRNPKTNSLTKNIKQAEQVIYILDMLEVKTKSNLTSLEKDHLRNTIGRLKRTFYEEVNQQEAALATSEVITIRHILVATLDEANDIRQQIVEGADFAELAQYNSQCNSRQDGGLIENMKKGSLPDNVEAEAFSLDMNEISKVVPSVFGYHIIKLVNRQQEE